MIFILLITTYNKKEYKGIWVFCVMYCIIGEYCANGF